MFLLKKWIIFLSNGCISFSQYTAVYCYGNCSTAKKLTCWQSQWLVPPSLIEIELTYSENLGKAAALPLITPLGSTQYLSKLIYLKVYCLGNTLKQATQLTISHGSGKNLVHMHTKTCLPIRFIKRQYFTLSQLIKQSLRL